MKTKEELSILKEEYESLSGKLAELSDDELEQVTGGVVYPFITAGKEVGYDIVKNDDGTFEKER